MKRTVLLAFVAIIVLAAVPAAAQQGDASGCKDHQLFPTRMPNYRIEACKMEDFGFYEFNLGKPPKTRVEARLSFAISASVMVHVPAAPPNPTPTGPSASPAHGAPVLDSVTPRDAQGRPVFAPVWITLAFP